MGKRTIRELLEILRDIPSNHEGREELELELSQKITEWLILRLFYMFVGGWIMANIIG